MRAGMTIRVLDIEWVSLGLYMVTIGLGCSS